MTTLASRPSATAPTAGPHRPVAETGAHKAARYVFAGVRIGIGWTFLWAFLDKLFGLGISTPDKNAWINGGHPTAGFLGKSATGPFTDLWHNAAGTWWADWLFMAGLLGIGLALILGIGMRIAAVAGTVLYVLMWSVVLHPATNPFLDDHLIQAGVLVGLALISAGDTLGFGAWWSRTSLVQRLPWLK
ncbi:MAG: DoxX family membrane protein [Hamadaea sp.]|uniref:DoxX family membrane protein n=1 Tax=Hamadaea sp. TaxID=2024425 RepID=UPI0017B85ADC|nr:DoxX family membrane protein [Hamadaea sp.]NUR50782.1 DoxX family membrane protein [Hamadaea sp.]NUT18943.1 DoxX family membrane protein [Hamadaea sp.]